MSKTSHVRNNGLDLLRSIAILSVLFLHQTEAIKTTPEWIHVIGRYGWSGVDIFFVLSGFLIGRQVYKDKSKLPFLASLKNFWVKRWFRTLPLYFVVLGFYMIIKPIVLNFPFQGSKLLYPFFLQNIFGIRDFPQSWSLCIEEHFYLIFPFFAFNFPLLRRKPIVILIPLFISLIMRAIVLSTHNIQGDPELSYLIRFPTYTNLDGIAFGVFLAYTQDQWKSYAEKFSSKIFLLGTLCFILALGICGPVPTGIAALLFPTLLAIGSAILLIGAYNLTVPKPLVPIFYWISICSYGMYLWNNTIFRFAEKYMQQYHWALGAIFCYIITFLMAFMTYKLIEIPFLKLRDHVLKKI